MCSDFQIYLFHQPFVNSSFKICKFGRYHFLCPRLISLYMGPNMNNHTSTYNKSIIVWYHVIDYICISNDTILYRILWKCDTISYHLIIHYGFYHIIQFYFDLFEQHYITQYVIASYGTTLHQYDSSKCSSRARSAGKYCEL